MHSGGLYRAVVTSTADPTNLRKIKVQCPQVAGTAELNWAEPLLFTDPIPDTGSLVWIFFSGGDTTKPVYMVTNTPSQYGWQTPVLATGWSFNTAFDGLGGPPLRFRKTAEDEVYFYGNIKAGAGATTLIFTLPATFFNPSGPGMAGFTFKNSSGTITPLSTAVDISTGNIFISSTPSSGDEIHFNVRMPMRFLIV